MKPYKKTNIPLAKRLRKEMTPWERKLWHEYLRYYPLRFQRQKAIGDYIVDFYCAKAQLVVELDGGGHYESEQEQADLLRTRKLREMGLQVIRICNRDIDKNFSGVCEYIDGIAKKSLPQSHAVTAPSSEGAVHGAKPSVIYALGFFDGVHVGHQALLQACRHLAQRTGCSAGVVTFANHPDTLVTGQTPLLINTLEQRQRMLHAYRMLHQIVLPFDETIKNMPWRDFLEDLLEKGAAGFVCGDDFRFGRGGEGNAQLLGDFCRERGLPWAVVPAQELDGVRVSSSHIRRLLEAGKMAEAVRFLGHAHVLTGEVVSGKQLGRTIDVPTANLLLPEGVVCPKFGVYACKAIVDGRAYLAVTNIGTRPTVNGDYVTVEAHLLDFRGDLYRKNISLQFYEFLRPEQKFGSLEVLQAEIRKNIAQTRKIFEKS